MKNLRTANWVILALILGALTLFSFNPINQQDPGFILKTGEYILQRHTVPRTDVFSLTAYGAPLVAHYWLMGVLFQLLYMWGGVAAVTSAVSLIALITFIFIFATARIKTKNVLLPAILAVLAFSLIYEFWVVRAQVFSYLFAAILLYLLERAWVKGSHRALWSLPLLFFAWANFHAGVILGIAIIWLFVGASIWRRRPFSLDEFSLKLVLIAAASTLVTLVNPNGYLLLTYSSIVAPVAAALGNLEWMSLLAFTSWHYKLFFAAMVTVTAFIIYRTIHKYRRGRGIDFYHLGLVIGAFVIPVASARHMIFFAIFLVPILVPELEELASERGIDLPKYLRANFAWLALAVLLFALSVWSVVNTVKAGLVDAATLPVKAVDFVEAQGLKGPFFNIEQGGYLIWRLYPEERVFRDGRDEVYRGQPLQEFLAITEGRPGWKELIDNKYHLNYFILWYRPPLFDPSGNITARITGELGFKLVYWDNTTVILVRDVPQNKKIIDKFAYNYVSPFLDPAKIPTPDLEKAEAEILRALHGDPNSAELQNYFVEMGYTYQ